MEITQYLNELVAMIPAILQYVVPGLLMCGTNQEVTVHCGLCSWCRSFCSAQEREN